MRCLRLSVAAMLMAVLGCSGTDSTERRACFDWAQEAPSRFEIQDGCNDADFVVDDFVIEECLDGSAIYYSRLLGGVSLIGDPVGPFLTTEQELEATIEPARAACHG